MIKDLVKKILGSKGDPSMRGITGWKTRIRETCSMTSPDGNTFDPKWIGDPRTMEKKLGIWQFPFVKGTVAQDLGTTANSYPLTLYFDGQDHDKAANSFFAACSQTGLWTVNHPTKGLLGLQLVKVKEAVEPVRNGSYTIFTTEWIEPLDPTTLKTTAQMLSEAGTDLNAFNDVAAGQFKGNLDTGSYGALNAIKDTVETIQQTMDNALGPIAAGVAGVNTLFAAANNAIQQILMAAVLDPLALATSIQNLAQLPALLGESVMAQLDAYTNMGKDIAAIPVIGDYKKNIAATKEVALCGVIGAYSVITTKGAASPGKIKTKSGVLSAIDGVSTDFMDIVNSLDDDQKLFNHDTIDDQYFSQSQSFTNAAGLIALSQEFLMKNFFNLRTEKAYILNVPSTPIKETILAYGNDERLDEFITSNHLAGSEVILLQPGKELVIYV